MDEISILLVEDIAINRFIIMQYLQSWWNIQVDEASNGLEAIEKVKANPYDIILMDIHMPEMDGYEAAKVIRSFADPALRNIPIIALTADTAGDLRNENTHAFTDVVTKPFNPNELYTKVIKYITAAKSKADLQEEASDDTGSKEIVNFQKIEDTLHHDITRVLSFYKVAEKALLDYKEKYEEAVRQKNAVEAGNVSHKAKMALKTLGFEVLLTRLEKGKSLIDKGASQEALKILLEEVNQRFDKAIDSIRNRCDQVMQYGL